MDGVGEGDEKKLLQEFCRCTRVYQRLQPGPRAVIADVTRRMADGMAEFVGKDLGEGTQTVDEYNRYCYYVAGLVGEGLTRLFHACGYESAAFERRALDPDVPSAQHRQGGLDKSMGLFLQKTNIIRDYLEDYVDGRAFWPKEVWALYATETHSLGEFAYPPPGSQTEARALALLNHLVTDALELVPDCLAYMELLTHPDIFRFCAIPQVRARLPPQRGGGDGRRPPPAPDLARHPRPRAAPLGPVGDGDRDARQGVRQPGRVHRRGQGAQGPRRQDDHDVRLAARHQGMVPRVCHRDQAPRAAARPVRRAHLLGVR